MILEVESRFTQRRIPASYPYRILVIRRKHAETKSSNSPVADWQTLEYWNQSQVSAYVHLKRTQLWRLKVAGLFPKRISLSERRVVWKAREVRTWMDDRAALRGAVASSGLARASASVRA